MANGDYELHVSAKYYDLNNQYRHEGSLPEDYPYTVDNGIIISNVSDSPDAFSPNADGRYDTASINYLLTKPGKVTLKLYDANNTLVRTLKDNLSEPEGTNSAVWDGTDNNGNPLPEGTYTYTIEAVDDEGNSATPRQGTISIDNHFMTITEPEVGSSLKQEVTFRAIASEYIHGERSVSFYYRPQGESSWRHIGYATKQDDGSWTIPWDTTTVANGDYELHVSAKYYDLNNQYRREGSLPEDYSVYNEGPDIDNLTAVPNPFSPDESGTFIDLDTGEVFNEPGPNRVLDDIAAISFIASTHGFFDIKIFDSNEQLIRQLVYQALYPDSETQEIEVQWDGRDDNGNFVKNGQYKLVVNAGSKEKEKSIMIGVDKKPFITNAKAIPDPFSPDEDGVDDTTTISYDISENAYVSVEIYQQDTLVRTLVDNQFFSYGSYSHIWDGKDEQGSDLPEGRYTIKISAQAEMGNIADPVFVNVSMLFISDIYISSDKINPYLGQTVTIAYRMSREGILSIKIYDSEDLLVRTLISDEPRSPGEHSEIWDGRDDNGNIVLDGPYYFIIEDSISGIPAVVYDPRGTGGKDISKSISFSVTDFNPLLNEFCTLTYDLPEPANINIKVRYRRYSGPAVKVIKFQEPTSSGRHQTLWNGRDEADNFVDYANFTFAIWGYTLDENSILVVGGRPVITNVSISPIRFSPYVSPYSSVSSQAEATISFDLSREANVAIDIYDSSGNLVRTLLDDALYNQGQNSVIWDGKDNQGRFVPTDFYRVTIQAHNGDNYSESITLHSEVFY